MKFNRDVLQGICSFLLSCLVLLPAGQALGQTILWMHFDGDVADSSASSLDGQWHGVPDYGPGIQNQGLNLSAAGDNYVTIESDDRLGGMDQLTVSVWAKKNDPAVGGNLFVKYSQYSLIVGADYVSAYVGNETGTLGRAAAYGVGAVHDTEWHHYVLAYDGSTVRVFVDNILTAESQLTGVVRLNSGQDLYIGKNPWDSTFDGQIDELEISLAAPDIDNPYIDGIYPSPGERWASPSTSINAHIKDDGKGVNRSSISMIVNGNEVSPEILGSSSDYLVSYTAPVDFDYDQEISVTLSAADLDGNRIQQSYSFTIRSETDSIPPRGYFYLEQISPSQVVVHSIIVDYESGMGTGALMRFSNDSESWSAPEAYAAEKDWILPVPDATNTVYAQYADASGNWTEVLSYTIGVEPTQEFVVSRHAPGSARLSWRRQAGISEYIILRSDALGWQGSTSLLQDIAVGDTTISIASTNGLQAGDELHFGNGRQDYYIARILDGQRLELTHPSQGNFTVGSYPVNLSGCWIKDYAAYTELVRTTDGIEYVDTGLTLERDYFYVIGYSDGTQILSYSNPVNIKLTESAMLYDAALGSNGGYAWKASQLYGDTPQLIDGDSATESIYIQYGNPALRTLSSSYRLGFHRVNLNDTTPIKRIEISQAAADNRIQAAKIKLGFDDRSEVEIDLTGDAAVECREENNYQLCRIPIDKVSSYVNISVEDISNSGGSYISWNKIGIYSEEQVERPLTSAVDLQSVDMSIDFSCSDGQLPAVFGTDEVYNNTEGHEAGWMLATWPYTKKIFNLYRIQLGDSWPRSYGNDLIKIGELAAGVSAAETVLPLTNITSAIEQLSYGNTVKIGYELMRFSGYSDEELLVYARGNEFSLQEDHPAGTPVYTYQAVGQILRLQEILPEFKVEKIPGAYLSGISTIDPDNVDFNDPSRTAVLDDVRMAAGDYAAGDVIRIGREFFEVLTVSSNGSESSLSLRRGFDGTNDPHIQHNAPVRAVYKILDYEPYYSNFKNDPADPSNYFWDNFNTTLDKVIKDGKAIPWLIVYSPRYATEHRGRVSHFDTVSNPDGIENNVLVDEHNSAHDDADWWYRIADGNTLDNDLVIRGNMYQFYHAPLHILTGQAAGKVFYVRSHSGGELRIVRNWIDSSWESDQGEEHFPPEYVDLAAEGVRPGDIYKIAQPARRYSVVSPKYWQYNADLMYNIAEYIKENYGSELGSRPIYMEYYLEPNLQSYGTWTKDSYIDSYNVFADTIRTGGPNFSSGFGKEEVIIGAGSIAGGLNPQIKISGASGDYDFALSMVERAEPIDFISHHRYYMGSRVQKRENSWEYWMLRNYALQHDKDIVIIDSEDSVATAGGTGREEARHWARFGVPYWEANFINSYYGEYGELGRLEFIVHFRLYSSLTGLGMASAEADGTPVLDLVYWPIEMYQDHTSTNLNSRDTLVRAVKGWDSYGWTQAMGTIHGETGQKHIHLVNKKDTPVTVNLTLLGTGSITEANLDSVIGGGPNQTITDGFHPTDYQGAGGNGVVINRAIEDLSSVVLEPFSANIISLQESTNPDSTPRTPSNLSIQILPEN
jgi:hypothetical protein